MSQFNVTTSVSAKGLSTMSQHICIFKNQSVKGLANPLRMVITMVEQKAYIGNSCNDHLSQMLCNLSITQQTETGLKMFQKNQVSIRNRWYLMSTELKTRKATLRTGVPCMYFSVREGETSQFQIVAFSAHVPTSSATAWRLHPKQPGKTPRDQATVN